MEFNAADWFWIVGGDDAKAWSSAVSDYVEASPGGAGVTRISSEGELSDVLRRYGLQGPHVTAADVKKEAERRILAIMPEYQQRNALALFAETAMVHGPDPAGWPAELQAQNTAVMEKWAAIKAIRARSNEIETMQPIPRDFREDSHWPVG